MFHGIIHLARSEIDYAFGIVYFEHYRVSTLFVCNDRIRPLTNMGKDMAYKDTLTLYNELKASGINEEQAQLQAAQLGGIGEHFAQSLDSFSKALDTLSIRLREIEKDLMWMRIIGGAMTFAFLSAAVWGK